MQASSKKVAFVTGSNQGLGFALVREIAKQLGEQVLVYLTARNEQRGQEALQILKNEGFNNIAFHLLDVGSAESVQTFANFIKTQHGGIDIFIHNAAHRILPEKTPKEQVQTFIEVNNHGTYTFLNAFKDIIKDGGRGVVVASGFGSLKNINPSFHSKFDVQNLSLEDIEANMDQFAESVKNETYLQEGWPEWINIPSKIGQVASVKILTRLKETDYRARDILINAACPGLVETEASKPWFKDMSTAKSPEEAAGDVVWLTTLPAGTKEPYGLLYQYKKEIPWI